MNRKTIITTLCATFVTTGIALACSGFIFIDYYYTGSGSFGGSNQTAKAMGEVAPYLAGTTSSDMELVSEYGYHDDSNGKGRKRRISSCPELFFRFTGTTNEGGDVFEGLGRLVTVYDSKGRSRTAIGEGIEVLEIVVTRGTVQFSDDGGFTIGFVRNGGL